MSNLNTPLRAAKRLDSFVNRCGRITSWVFALLILCILIQVILRYGFNHGLVLLEELQWHLYAIGIMFGLSYGQVHNLHIRVDLFHRKFNQKTQHIIEILGILFLLMPFIIIIIIHSIDFVTDSWRINEHSNAVSGLPWRWIIKSIIPLSFCLLLLSVLSQLVKDVTFLISFRK